MKTKFGILGGATFVMISCWVLPASAREGDTLWTRTYGRPYVDGSYSLIETSDGHYLIAGATYLTGGTGSRMWLIKTDQEGDTVWTRMYGSWHDNWARSVIETTDGCYLITGEGTVSTNHDFWLFKTNTDGDTLWRRIFGNQSDYEGGRCVVETSDGGYLAGGTTDTYPWIIRTNTQGDTIWTFMADSYGSAYSVIETTDQHYMLAGELDNSVILADMWLLCMNPDGESLWERNYGGSNVDLAYSVIELSDGGYLVAGTTNSFGSGSVDVYAVRTDIDGDTVWTRTYGGTGSDGAHAATKTADNCFLLAGYTGSYGGGLKDVWLLKINSHGDTLWTRTFGGSYNDGAEAVIQTSDGNYLVAGGTYSYGVGNGDIWLLCIEGPPTDAPPQALRDAPGFVLQGSYPNPFNSTATIWFTLPEPSWVTLKVFNMLGRSIDRNYSIQSEKGWMTSGAHSIIFDGSGLPSGIYFYQIQTLNQGAIGKMLIVK